MNYFPMERNRYFYGKLLTVRDFEVEQNYSVSKRCLLNRVLYGPGVVCGLDVTCNADSTLIIGSGIALDYEGHEIVIEAPLLRKIQMIDGQENLGNSNDCWLCLNYKEKPIEPVNSLTSVEASDVDGRQCNLISESYELSLSTKEPDYVSILSNNGYENVNVIYHTDELSLILCSSSCVIGGDDLKLSMLIVKNELTPPVQFTLEGKNSFVESSKNTLKIDFHEASDETRKVYFADFLVKTQSIKNSQAALLPEGAELNIECGSHHYKEMVDLDAHVTLVADKNEVEKHYNAIDSLEKHISGSGLPIYLAKIELIRSAGLVFVNSVTSLPLGQKVSNIKDSDDKSSGVSELTINTSVRGLEYYKKPEVSAKYNENKKSIDFDFGIPSPEQYDFTSTHGYVDITLPGGNRVNARYYSEEIPHGLGNGAVDVRLAIEYREDNISHLLVGNKEVFKNNKNVPNAEAAAIIYPERGTMLIGLWLHDDVRGTSVRVHYFASRPNMDKNQIIDRREVTVAITPEMTRVAKEKRTTFTAIVDGTEDQSVRWSVVETDGGSIDNEGIYTAPKKKGTYEIKAVSLADETVSASAFVIVE